MKPKNIIFTKSNRKNKKYRVDFIYNGKHYKIHFGHPAYEQYKDQTGIGAFSYMDHKDKDRRKRYRKRASMIKNKRGEYTVFDPLSPNYWAFRFLW